MLLAIGIPLVAFFIQVDGAVRFSTADKVFERTLTVDEQKEIRAAIDKHKAKLDTMQRIVEDVKETYRGETGASYERDVWVVHDKEGLAVPYKYILGLGAERDVWVVHDKEGLAVPYKYILGLGALLFLIGLGKLFI